MFSAYFRGQHKNDLIPGNFVLEKRSCYVPYGGKEVSLTCFEILLNENFDWTASSNGNIHENAVIGGVTSSGEDLFIGRVIRDGHLMPGKIHPSHKTMYVPSAGGEHLYNSYEILVTSTPGDRSDSSLKSFTHFWFSGFPTEATIHSPSQFQPYSSQQVHDATPNRFPKPFAPMVPVPGVNASPTDNVAKSSSGKRLLNLHGRHNDGPFFRLDIGWMISSEGNYQHPNIPSEKLIQCQLCSDQLIEGVFIPCGHCACYKCGSTLSQCHKCGRQIEKVQRIYFA